MRTGLILTPVKPLHASGGGCERLPARALICHSLPRHAQGPAARGAQRGPRSQTFMATKAKSHLLTVVNRLADSTRCAISTDFTTGCAFHLCIELRRGGWSLRGDCPNLAKIRFGRWVALLWPRVYFRSNYIGCPWPGPGPAGSQGTPLLSLAGRDGNEAAGKKASGRLPGERGHGRSIPADRAPPPCSPMVHLSDL